VFTFRGFAATGPASAQTPARSRRRSRTPGQQSFARAPTQFIEAIVTQKSDGYQVSIAMRGGEGKLLGSRALTSSPGDCRSIATAAALTIAIMIDPDALARAPAPKPPPPAPPAPPPASARFPAGRMAALVGAGWGFVPGVAPGAGLTATIDVSAPIAIGVAAVLFPEQRTSPPDDGFAFGLTYGEALGCFLPLAALAPTAKPRLELCAGASVGLLHAVVFSGTPSTPSERWTLPPRSKRAWRSRSSGRSSPRSPSRPPNPCPAARFSLKDARLGWTLCLPSRW
jgi:hypothetical protein